MSYKPLFTFAGGQVQGNTLRFASRNEADFSAYQSYVNACSRGADLSGHWTVPLSWYVEESDDPVNYVWDFKAHKTSPVAP